MDEEHEWIGSTLVSWNSRRHGLASRTFFVPKVEVKFLTSRSLILGSYTAPSMWVRIPCSQFTVELELVCRRDPKFSNARLQQFEID